MTPSCHAALIVPLKVEASCANDKTKKELTDHLRCLDGRRCEGSGIGLCLNRKKGSGVEITEWANGGDRLGSSNIDAVSNASTGVREVNSGWI